MASKQVPIFESVWESVPDAIVVVDATGEIRYANPRVDDLFDYDPEELVGQTVEVLVPAAFRDEHVDYRNAYMGEPESRPMGANLELRAERKDGTTVPVDISLSPLERTGEPMVVAVVRDVSEQEALRSKYRAILESTPDAIFVVDLDSGEIVEVNDRASELLGYPPDELVGAHQTALHPSDDTEKYRALFDREFEVEDTFHQFPDGSPVRIERADGEHVPVEIRAEEFELGNRRLRVGAFRDISDRLARERELERAQTVIQASGDAVYMLDPDGRFRFVNEALCRLSGYSEDDLLGKHVSVVMEPPDIEQGRRLIQELLVSEKERGTFEMAIETADGRVIPTENHIAVIESEDGRLAASVGILRDISDRKEREEALERQNRRLDDFASVVSHDLRNPLNVAHGWLDVAQDEPPSDELQRVEDALHRMESIIDDTLTLARNGQTVGETEVVDMAEIVHGCWGMVSTADSAIELTDAFSIRADRDRLQHVLENLFRNAIEYAGPDATVTVGPLDNHGFYVEDDGPGIPPDTRATVFDAGESEGNGGTGLGLTIVKQIAESHGWTVSVAEGSDGGARFEFTDVDVVD